MQTANFQLLLIVLILMNCRNGHLQQRFVVFSVLKKRRRIKKIMIFVWLVVLFVCFILFIQHLHVVINVFDYLVCVNFTFAAYSSYSCDASFFSVE